MKEAVYGENRERFGLERGVARRKAAETEYWLQNCSFMVSISMYGNSLLSTPIGQSWLRC